MLLDYVGHLIAALVTAAGWLSSHNVRGRIEQELQSQYPNDRVPELADVGNLSALWAKRRAAAELAPSAAIFAVAAKAFSQDRDLIGELLLLMAIVIWVALLRVTSGSLLDADATYRLQAWRFKLDVARDSALTVAELFIVATASVGTFVLTRT